MSYRVIIQAPAIAELDAIFAYIARESPQNAAARFDRIIGRIEALSSFPNRHPLAPEADVLLVPVRQIIIKPYRVLFQVHAAEVHIIGIRHGARLPLDD